MSPGSARRLLDIDDLDPGGLEEVLSLADDQNPPQVLAGKGVGLIFEKPSTRTRNSTEMAVVALGGHPVSMSGAEVGLGSREEPADVVRVLGRYHALLGARVEDHRALEEMATAGSVPVLNLLSERAHPCQAIADLLTLRRRWGVLAGHRLAWVGDGNNVARSLLAACARSGISVALACPPGHGLPEEDLDAARAAGGEVEQCSEPARAVAGADAVATDVWVSMGQEAESAGRLAAFAGYKVSAELMGMAAPGAVFMHCLPAHRGVEVDADVIDGPASVVWEQAGNRLDAARGVLAWLVGERP